MNVALDGTFSKSSRHFARWPPIFFLYNEEADEKLWLFDKRIIIENRTYFYHTIQIKSEKEKEKEEKTSVRTCRSHFHSHTDFCVLSVGMIEFNGGC